MPRLRALADKLARLGGLEGTDANWSGASWALGAPIGEAELAGLELAHRITFPAEYRRFVREIADGGAGPGYGMSAVAAAIGERGDGVWALSDPFVAPQDCADWVDFRAPGILPVQYDGCEYHAGLVISGPERGTMWSYVAVEPGWVPIVLGPLHDRGGAPYVLRGSELADYHAWYDVLLQPQNRAGRATFLDWYEDWVDGVLATAAS